MRIPPVYPSSLPRLHTPTPSDIEAVGDEIARLSARVNAAQLELLTLLREFDAAEGWSAGGFRSCAHWLSWRTGLSLGPAREKVRVARALEHLPKIGGEMAAGRCSYSKVRALTRVATAENEAALIEFSEHATVSQVERMVREWKRVDRQEDPNIDELRHQRRYLSVYPNGEGMYEVRGRLTPEVGALLSKALELAEAELYRSKSECSAEQRRADAMGEVLRKQGNAAIQALICVAEDGSAHTEEGVHVSPETSKQLTCDAEVTRVTRTAEGRVLDVGRTRRTVPGRMRKALKVRDQGRCRFPRCSSTRCDAHHIRHWSDGGETRLGNLVLLCRFHHRQIHHGRFQVEMNAAGEPRFRWPDGTEISAVPAPETVTPGDVNRWLGERPEISPEAGMPLGLWGGINYELAVADFRGR